MRLSRRGFSALDIRQVREGTEPLAAIPARPLVAATQQLEGESNGDRLAVARLQSRLGISLLSLDYAKDAANLLSKATATYFTEIDEADFDRITILNNLANAYLAAGHTARAVALAQELSGSVLKEFLANCQEPFNALATIGSGRTLHRR